MPADFRLTIWPQDPFVVLDGGDGPRLYASREFERAGDAAMAPAIARHLGTPLIRSTLTFEGGNIVSDREQVFVGADTVQLNALELGRPARDIARRFGDELGKPVVVIGPSPQPVGHIDMVLTPLGGGRVMLADPDWGARLAAAELDSRPEAVSQFEHDAERNFFGDPAIARVKIRDGGAATAPAVIGATRQAIDDSRDIAPALDRIAAELERLDFDVFRVPYLARAPEAAQQPVAGETVRLRPGYPQLTYNNVLLEGTGDTATVYLPVYGWQALDDAAADAWRARGFRVRPIAGFATTAMYGGALRCSVKVLARRDAR